MIARRKLASSGDPLIAYQAAAASPCAMPRAAAEPRSGLTESGVQINDPLVFFSPGAQRVAVFDPSAGAVMSLATGTFAASAWQSGNTHGYLCATKDGVVFDPLNTRNAAQNDSRPIARVIASPAVPRITRHPETPVFLFGPVAGDPLRLSITAMAASAED